MKPILGVCIYFCATLLMSRYFVGVSFIKAVLSKMLMGSPGGIFGIKTIS